MNAPGQFLNLPPHIEKAVQSIALLDNAHRNSASRLERLVDFASTQVSRPACLIFLSAASLGWVASNLGLGALGLPAFDPPPFAWGNDALSFLALVMAVMIVTTQRRAGRLSERREQLTLELTLLTEQKTAKIIALIEEIRRESPQLANRVDRQASAMSAPADANLVLGAIDESASAGRQAADADIAKEAP